MPRNLLRLNVLLEATSAWGRSQSFEALVHELPRIKWVLEFSRCVIRIDGSARVPPRVFVVRPSGAREADRDILVADDEALLANADAPGSADADRRRSSLAFPLESGARPLGAICFLSTEIPYDPHDFRLAQFIAQALSGIVDRLLAREEERAETEASRQKDEFLAMLGHELRNPLAPMVTAIALLKQRDLPDAGRLIAVLERQTAHMKRLVDDLLDISRVQQGKIALERRQLDLAEVVHEAVEMVLPTLKERQHQVTVEVDPDRLFVDADPARLTQILTNLLTNASKFSEPGKPVTLRGQREDDMVRVTVEDHGDGIAPEMLSMLFEPFVQGARTLDRSRGGLGLGLPVALALARLHGGTLAATSGGLGQGSAFTLSLPALDAIDSLDAPISRLRSTAPSGFGKVIVVDDNRDAADLLADGLRAQGYEVLTAYESTHALELIARERPAAALLDLGLPVMDGFALARTLRQRFPPQQLRLIAVTGYGERSDREASLAAGFDAHVIKPADLAVVHDLLVAPTVGATPDPDR